MKNNILVYIFVFILPIFGLFTKAEFAESKEPIISVNSSYISTNSSTQKKKDLRAVKLKNYLKGYPLENNYKDFIEIADKYGFSKHAYLVAAIGGVESTFGQFIPYGSYNAWGFGIPTGAQSGIVFTDWKAGIEEVTKTIRTKYLYNVKNLNNLSTEELVYSIGPIYAASPTWAQRVLYFMEKIENTSTMPLLAEHLTLNL